MTQITLVRLTSHSDEIEDFRNQSFTVDEEQSSSHDDFAGQNFSAMDGLLSDSQLLKPVINAVEDQHKTVSDQKSGPDDTIYMGYKSRYSSLLFAWLR